MLTAINFLGRVSQLLFYLALGNRFGVNKGTDEIIFLQTPLLVLMTVLAGAAESVVIPAFHRAADRHAAKYLLLYAVKRIFAFVLPVSGALLLIFSFLHGEVDVLLLAILLPIPLLGSLAALKTGVLNASNRFRVALLGPLSGGILAVPFAFLTKPTGYGFALSLLLFEWGKLCGVVFFKDMTSGGFPARSTDSDAILHWGTTNALWQIAGSLILALVFLVDILFAATLEQGAVTSVDYANRLWNIIPLFFVGHITMTYAALSRSSCTGSAMPTGMVNEAALRYGIVAFLLSMVLIVVSPYLIGFLYGHGSFTSANQRKLTGLLQCYFIGAGPYVGGLIYVRALSASGRVSILTIVACIGLLVNIAADYLLVQCVGLNGIGLATSLVYCMNTLVLAICYHRIKTAGNYAIF